MKLIVALFSILSAGAAAAESEPACINLAGTYLVFDGIYSTIPTRYEQEGCKTVTRYGAPGMVRGKLVFKTKRVYELGGEGVCVNGDRCENAVIEGNTIKFTYNFDALRSTLEHGNCRARTSVINKQSDGSLIEKVQLKKCADGFEGEYVFALAPYNGFDL